MKKVVLILFILFFSFSNAQSEKMNTKIRSYKIAYITDKLDLSEKEAEKFWPLYNAYDKKMMEIHHQERIDVRKKIKSVGGFNNLSEDDAKSILNKIELLMNERHQNKTNFSKKIKRFLSYKKILQLEIAEHEFNRKLMRKLKEKRHR